MVDGFWDETAGGFFFTSSDHERLITRTKPAVDGSVPSGNSLATELCLRLATLTGGRDFAEKGERVLRLHQKGMAENPFAYANLLAALDLHLRGADEVAVVAPGGAAGATSLLAPLGKHYAPNAVVVCHDPDAPPARVPPFAVGKTALDSRATAYVCRGFTCSRPVTAWEELRAELDGPR
jgi:hypothetical protein